VTWADLEPSSRPQVDFPSLLPGLIVFNFISVFVEDEAIVCLYHYFTCPPVCVFLCLSVCFSVSVCVGVILEFCWIRTLIVLCYSFTYCSLSVCLSACVSLCLYLYLSVVSWRIIARMQRCSSPCLSICGFVCVSVCLSVSVSLSVIYSISVNHNSNAAVLYLSVCMFVCVSVCPSVCQSVCLCQSLCLPAYQSVCLFVVSWRIVTRTQQYSFIVSSGPASKYVPGLIIIRPASITQWTRPTGTPLPHTLLASFKDQFFVTVILMMMMMMMVIVVIFSLQWTKGLWRKLKTELRWLQSEHFNAEWTV